jgi:hypothetical protein
MTRGGSRTRRSRRRCAVTPSLGEGDDIVVEVADAGVIEQPLVGRLRPTVEQEGGRGLWIANQLCDLVQVRSGAEGTVVRLRARRHG